MVHTNDHNFMKIITTIFVTGLMALLTVSTANAQSLTTLFASDNSGNLGGAVYFDAQIGALGLVVDGFDTNTAELVTFDFTVFTLFGTSHVGNEFGAGWIQVATGTGVGAGDDNPSPVTLDNTFLLDANTLYGMAVVLGPNAGHDYTNGTGGNQFFSNADLSLSLGSASNVPFTAPLFSPRVWNGTIHYSTIPEPSTIAFLGLAAAVGLIGYRRRRSKTNQ